MTQSLMPIKAAQTDQEDIILDSRSENQIEHGLPNSIIYFFILETIMLLCEIY